MTNRVPVPPPGRSSTTVPPCDCATARTIASPRPEPRPPSRPPRTKRSNTAAASSVGMPGPSSSTVRTASPSLAPVAALDRGTRRGVADRVLEQVEDQAVQLVADAVDDRRLGGDRQLVALGHRPELGRGLDQDVGRGRSGGGAGRGGRRRGPAAAGRRPAGACAASSAAPPRRSRPARRRAPRSAAPGWPARWSAACGARATRRPRTPAGGRASPGCRCAPRPAPPSIPSSVRASSAISSSASGCGIRRLASRVRSISRAASVSSTIGRIARAETNRPASRARIVPPSTPSSRNTCTRRRCGRRRTAAGRRAASTRADRLDARAARTATR